MDPIFNAARRAWSDGADLRSRRARLKRYTYGDQWSDPCLMSDGRVVTEAEKARLSGASPMTNNLMRQIVKSVVGRFRTMRRQSDDATLRSLHSRNLMAELDARALEEFLISGCAIQRIVSERRPAGDGPWVDNVSPARFFVNRFSDPRGGDIELAGMIHDMSLAELTMRFGGGDTARERDLAALYTSSDPGLADDCFGAPAPRDRCRVIEVWTLEGCEVLRCHDRQTARAYVARPSDLPAIENLNRVRKARSLDTIVWRRMPSLQWCGRFFTPSGELLKSIVSPWRHGSHPFVIKLYPLIDGEVHPFVEDIVDTQRHVNRLITLIDHIMGVSAKGALLFPVRAKHPDIPWSEYAARWSQPGAVIPYIETPSGAVPASVTASASNAGAGELLQTELRLMEQISGVSSALQGQKVDGLGGSASLYNAQADNSVAALRDIFDTFDAFTQARDEKLSLMYNG